MFVSMLLNTQKVTPYKRTIFVLCIQEFMNKTFKNDKQCEKQMSTDQCSRVLYLSLYMCFIIFSFVFYMVKTTATSDKNNVIS